MLTNIQKLFNQYGQSANWHGSAYTFIYHVSKVMRNDISQYCIYGRNPSDHMQYSPLHTMKLKHNKIYIQYNLPGLIGPQGVFPYNDRILAKLGGNEKKESIQYFFDIFHHALTDIAYQSWITSKVTLSYHQRKCDITKQSYDQFAAQKNLHQTMANVAGIHKLVDKVDDFLVAEAVAIRSKNISASVLESLLQEFFRMPIVVKQHQWERCLVPKADQFHLSSTTQQQHYQLGGNSLLGKYIYCAQHKIHIEIGPLSLADYQKLLPSGEYNLALMKLIQKILPAHWRLGVHLILAKDEIPALQCNNPIYQLGRTTWLQARLHKQHAKAYHYCIQ